MLSRLVLGLPRSGSTWVAQMPAQADAIAYLPEPDNPFIWGHAARVKWGLGAYPVVTAAAQDGLERLWTRAFTVNEHAPTFVGRLGRRLYWPHRHSATQPRSRILPRSKQAMLALGLTLAEPASPPRSGQRPLVKTVMAPFCTDWLLQRFPVAAVGVRKQPLNLVASWMQRGWGPPLADEPAFACSHDPREVVGPLLPKMEFPPAPDPHETLRRLTWELGLMAACLSAALDRAGSMQLQHERLCIDPEEGFRVAYDHLGLGWTEAAEKFLRSADRQGSAPYDVRRQASAEVDRWRTRLSREEVRIIRSVSDNFPDAW